MLTQSPEPKAHDKELTIIQIELEFGNVAFLRREENQSKSGEKALRARNNKRKPHNATGCGNRTRDTLVEGERPHHCAIRAPHCKVLKKRSKITTVKRLTYSALAKRQLRYLVNVLIRPSSTLFRISLAHPRSTRVPLETKPFILTEYIELSQIVELLVSTSYFGIHLPGTGRCLSRKEKENDYYY